MLYLHLIFFFVILDINNKVNDDLAYVGSNIGFLFGDNIQLKTIVFA